MPTKSISPNGQLGPRAHAPAGGPNLIASFKNDIIGQTTTSFATSTKVMHGEEAYTQAEVTTLYHGNQQYSVTAISESGGNVSERYAYTAYGQPTFLNASGTVQTSSAASNRYTFTGREWDATLGLYHFRARWMSGLTGRFLTRDPTGFRKTWNLFTWVDSRSLSRVDPSGKESVNPVPVGPFVGSSCKIAKKCGPAKWNMGTHCGLVVEIDSGTYTVDGDNFDGQNDIDWVPSYGDFHEEYGVTEPFVDYPVSVCECLRVSSVSWNGFNIPYYFWNQNSNFALGCLARKCGVNLAFKGGEPHGYGMQCCLAYSPPWTPTGICPGMPSSPACLRFGNCCDRYFQ